MSKNQFRLGAILASFLLVVCFLPSPLFAQLDTGGITGTVTDPSGAVVPGAHVTLTNTDTSVAQTMPTTSTGTYSFSGVRPGAYSLTVEASGFEKYLAEGIQIHVQQVVTADVPL
ncbi:MAG TPA: carboxypeptidase-like regulatory domain-containing protein, partial [Anaerolineales bacterium]|nr:carboxypeptidase-like regulatory domain-containing protein [Anaerolineales bacterium]